MSDVLQRVLRTCFPSVPAFSALGEGDYCAAYRVEPDWTFLIAKTAFATACLERVARVTPILSAGAPLEIPNVRWSGIVDGAGFIGYSTVPGEPLRASRLAAMSPRERDACAARLAAFLAHVHAFDPATARSIGVPESAYPFVMLEDRACEGSAPDLFRQDLAAFLASLVANAELEAFLTDQLNAHLARLEDGTAHVLLHNEVSSDHVFCDPETLTLTGVIDLNGMVISRPARDFLYIFEEYGPGFTRAVLLEYGQLDVPEALRELHFLRVWHTLARLLWALDHRYAPGIEARLQELNSLGQSP